MLLPRLFVIGAPNADVDIECDLLGWPPDGPKLRLDYRQFSYAGKFVMTNTGKAVARDDGEVVAAVAFNEDRTDPDTLWLRYVTVRQDRRGEGIGPRLCRFVRDRAIERGYDRLRIAVNNPFAYEALYRSGFGYTGEQTGIAELVLEYPRYSVRDDDGELRADRSDRNADESRDDRGSRDADRGGRDADADRGDGNYGSDRGDRDADADRGERDADEDHADGTARERYQAGLEAFRERDLSVEEETFLESRRGRDPPDPAGEANV